MKEGPNISFVVALVGVPARANMLCALMDGRALTATELAQEAGVTAQTASSHLARLLSGGLLSEERQGRSRYYRISGEDVAHMLEDLMGIAARTGHMRVRTGPRDPELRRARICYDHLAGELGVALFDSLTEGGLIQKDAEGLRLTPAGRRKLEAFGLDLAGLERGRRPPAALVSIGASGALTSAARSARRCSNNSCRGFGLRHEKPGRVARLHAGGEKALRAFLAGLDG
jgi:DNA-binding transcriptional ArsR family regulator